MGNALHRCAKQGWCVTIRGMARKINHQRPCFDKRPTERASGGGGGDRYSARWRDTRPIPAPAAIAAFKAKQAGQPPELKAALKACPNNPFVQSCESRWNRYGVLSEKQLEVLAKCANEASEPSNSVSRV